MDLFTAKKLTELRKFNSLSQEALAEKVGVSRQAISKWERGEASPDTDNLLTLSKIYGISLDDLLGDMTADEIIEKKQNEAPPKLYSEIKAEEEQKEKEKEKTKSKKEPYVPGVGKMLLKIPYFLIIIISYLVIGFSAGLWHPTWIMFLTIPAYYITAAALLAPTRKKLLLSLPIYMYAIILYIVMGFTANLWHPAWLIFLCIPAYYWAIGLSKS